MNQTQVSQDDIANLILEIKQTSSFSNKILAVLNWSKNNMARTLFCGSTWFNETSFFLSHTQVASLFGVKPDTLLSALKKHGFVKSFSPVPSIQKFIWSKPGFTMEGDSSNQQSNNEPKADNTTISHCADTVSSKISTETVCDMSIETNLNETPTDSNSIHSDDNDSIHQPLKFDNDEFNQIIKKIFTSDNIKCLNLISLFHKHFCPLYIDINFVEQTFKDYFYLNIEQTDDICIDKESFWVFYQHFGPLNSLFAKYSLFKEFESKVNESGTNIVIDRSKSNAFLYSNRFLIFNDFKKDIGTFYLSDESERLYNSWNKIPEQLDKIPENIVITPLPRVYNRYPISSEKDLSNVDNQWQIEGL